MNEFYQDVNEKRKNKKYGYKQILNFSRPKLKINKKFNNVDMFSTSVRGGKLLLQNKK